METLFRKEFYIANSYPHAPKRLVKGFITEKDRWDHIRAFIIEDGSPTLLHYNPTKGVFFYCVEWMGNDAIIPHNPSCEVIELLNRIHSSAVGLWQVKDYNEYITGAILSNPGARTAVKQPIYTF
jgi:hypothetical protein